MLIQREGSVGKLRLEPKQAVKKEYNPKCSVCGLPINGKHFNLLCSSVVWEAISPQRSVDMKKVLFEDIFLNRINIGWLPYEFVFGVEDEEDIEEFGAM